MSFDASTSSALDDVEVCFPNPGKQRSARCVRVKMLEDSSSVSRDFAAYTTTPTGGSDPLLTSLEPYVVVSDVAAFSEWVTRTNSAAIVDTVARLLGQRFGSSVVEAALEIESEDPTVQRVMLTANVGVEEADAMERLFEFTEGDWWLRLTRKVDLVVDIKRG